MRIHARAGRCAALLTIAVLATGCGEARDSEQASAKGSTQRAEVVDELPSGDVPVRLTPSRFTNEITHPYWPMPVGSVRTYEGIDGDGKRKRVVSRVTDEEREIAGIDVRVVEEQAFQESRLLSTSYDYYAQDVDGNVWYLGSKEYKHAKDGSRYVDDEWYEGSDEADAGVMLPGSPRQGQVYREEYVHEEEPEVAQILDVNASVRVRLGSYTGALMTKNYTADGEGGVEHKTYARGIGPVLAVSVVGDGQRLELVEFRRG